MKLHLILLGLFLFYGCSSAEQTTPEDANQPPQNNNPRWSIPVAAVLDGGPGKDGIPALENPNFIRADETTVLQNSDLVLAFKNGDEVRAYPHIILDWHEIINDNIGDVSMAITFCPLTGTGIGWGRILNDTETTFGVSGLLYNTNLIPYDRLTDSNWSQILNESVNGDLIGSKPELYQLLETNWGILKQMFPEVEVVSTNTGFSRTYGVSPYGNYNTDHDFFLFPVDKDPRLPSKEKVLAILDGNRAKAYQFSDFETDNVFRDTYGGNELLLVGNQDFITVFALESDMVNLEFEYAFNAENGAVVLTDNEGNEWNVFGEAVSGPREGAQLEQVEAMMAQWFSIPAFYQTQLYSE
ncbi:DUF3179 domain-containing protein [Flagellimonas myxillae]|uniref:DUF3179 domain-containing protein n=1 Tax=Flagellimonas myxillae TaxID=2942214 RepID=UPI00201EFC88|nr:DUF3179 domain-containing protein [Muricauda myxillae]MCL6267708.1 DUF3179 domain-containing protein [Muricauda myxillae]